MCDEVRLTKADNNGNCAQRYTVMRNRVPAGGLVAEDQRHTVMAQNVARRVAEDQVAP